MHRERSPCSSALSDRSAAAPDAGAGRCVCAGGPASAAAGLLIDTSDARVSYSPAILLVVAAPRYAYSRTAAAPARARECGGAAVPDRGPSMYDTRTCG